MGHLMRSAGGHLLRRGGHLFSDGNGSDCCCGGSSCVCPDVVALGIANLTAHCTFVLVQKDTFGAYNGTATFSGTVALSWDGPGTCTWQGTFTWGGSGPLAGTPDAISITLESSGMDNFGDPTCFWQMAMTGCEFGPNAQLATTVGNHTPVGTYTFQPIADNDAGCFNFASGSSLAMNVTNP